MVHWGSKTRRDRIGVPRDENAVNTIGTSVAAATPQQATWGDEPKARAGATDRGAGGTLAPAVQLTLATTSIRTSERLVVYGRTGTLNRADRDPSVKETPEATQADPADVLDRKLAEGRKELAALQIAQLKVATRDAGVLALLDPRAAITYAKHAANALSGAARAFGEGESTIQGIEDKAGAEAPEAVTAVARDTVTRTVSLELSATGEAEGLEGLEAAIRRLSAGDAEAGDGAAPARRAATAGAGAATRLLRLDATTRTEATTIVTVQADGAARTLDADTAADRSARLGRDAEVIKDAIGALRHLGRLIAGATKRLQEVGGPDTRTMGELSDAQNAFSDAIADTTRAALPIVRAGFAITPDDAA
jgi:hypothetical protein